MSWHPEKTITKSFSEAAASWDSRAVTVWWKLVLSVVAEPEHTVRMSVSSQIISHTLLLLFVENISLQSLVNFGSYLEKMDCLEVGLRYFNYSDVSFFFNCVRQLKSHLYAEHGTMRDKLCVFVWVKRKENSLPYLRASCRKKNLL